jgi:hypothetical protein
VFVSDDVETVKSILAVEDDFNAALDGVVEFLGKRGKLDPDDAGCLCILDILRLRQVFDVLHRERVKVMVSVATVAEVPVFEGSLLRFMEGD